MKTERLGPIAVVTLDRPDDGNRVNAILASELRQVCGELSADDALRVVIWTGSGPVFSVGREAPSGAEQTRELQAARAMAALPIPTIAALNGDATDHGLEVALSADLRVAAHGATLGFSPPSAGGFPIDGGTQRLPRLVGPGWARDLLLTGRRVDANEALAIGLVNRIASVGEDVLQMALELANQISASSPWGARYIKEAIAVGADMTLHQALGLEADLSVILQSTADRAEGIASFLERRAPEFLGE